MLQTIPVPQPRPFGASPVSMQREVPVAQEVVPTLQGEGMQGALAEQVAQLPLLHTRPLPQDWPLGALPDSAHWEVPFAQEVVPTLQAEGSQAMLAEQVTQSPLLHTRPLPQDRPLGALPDSRHSDAPDAQEVVPVLHALPVEQDASAVQRVQLPLLQTMFVPQVVPLRTLVPVSLHSAMPLSQVSVPV